VRLIEADSLTAIILRDAARFGNGDVDDTATQRVVPARGIGAGSVVIGNWLPSDKQTGS
jgi:hypothetical protein